MTGAVGGYTVSSYDSKSYDATWAPGQDIASGKDPVSFSSSMLHSTVVGVPVGLLAGGFTLALTAGGVEGTISNLEKRMRYGVIPAAAGLAVAGVVGLINYGINCDSDDRYPVTQVKGDDLDAFLKEHSEVRTPNLYENDAGAIVGATPERVTDGLFRALDTNHDDVIDLKESQKPVTLFRAGYEDHQMLFADIVAYADRAEGDGDHKASRDEVEKTFGKELTESVRASSRSEDSSISFDQEVIRDNVDGDFIMENFVGIRPISNPNGAFCSMGAVGGSGYESMLDQLANGQLKPAN